VFPALGWSHVMSCVPGSRLVTCNAMWCRREPCCYHLGVWENTCHVTYLSTGITYFYHDPCTYECDADAGLEAWSHGQSPSLGRRQAVEGLDAHLEAPLLGVDEVIFCLHVQHQGQTCRRRGKDGSVITKYPRMYTLTPSTTLKGRREHCKCVRV
jgi:hypothetical protein